MNGAPVFEGGCFVAIDFETANEDRTSACAVALVRVEGERVVERRVSLIRPPSRLFAFTHIHGLTWDKVKGAPTFAQLWPTLAPMLEGATYLIAHNASFDREVLTKCCEAAGLPLPTIKWACTVQIARRKWPAWGSHKLNLCCDRLSIPLQHHEALSDALACAEIYLRAQDRQLVRSAPVTPATAGKTKTSCEVRPAPAAASPPVSATPPAPSELDALRDWFRAGQEVAHGRGAPPDAFDTPAHEMAFACGHAAARQEQCRLELVSQHAALTAQHAARWRRLAEILGKTVEELDALLAAPVPAVGNEAKAADEVVQALCPVCKVGSLIDNGRRCVRCGHFTEESAA